MAWAASDITVATIATGRLYVAGTSDRPRTPIVLEGRFRTESDASGRFQFEAIYHPARCIVGVEIDGKTYEAVVGNCGQQGPPGEPGSAKVTGAVADRGPPGPRDAPVLPKAKDAAPTHAADAKRSPAVDQPHVKRRSPPPRPKVPRKRSPADDALEPADTPSGN